ncbi:MAG: PHB depolymerase family esterase [Bacteroidota bacterium]|nr:PHB depolymerase family esterase [Bacteroidota bacterium]
MTCNLLLFGGDLKEVLNFGSNPGNLKLFKFNDSLAKNKPLVLVLHGCVQNAERLEELTDWKKAAVKNDFVVFYPQQKIINNASNCFNFFLESDINKNGECLSIYQMMRYAIDTLKVDSTRIFLYGASAGACMSEVVCANYPWLINTAALCGAIPYRTYTGLKTINLLGKTEIRPAKEWGDLVRNQNTFYTGKYPRIILAHGTEDFVTDYGYAAEIIKQWTNVHGITDQPTDGVPRFGNNDKVDLYIYGDGKQKAVVKFYRIKDVSHQLPVDVGAGDKQGGQDKIFSTDIDFFLTYYIVKDFGLMK